MTEQTNTAPLRGELERKTASPAEQTIFDLVARQRPEIEKVLPPSITVDRFERVMRTEVRRNPRLGECDPSSFLGALMLSAQLGLEPGPLGHVYLVPFKRQVEFIVGYRGYVELAYRSGQVKQVQAAVVYEGEAFDYRKGTRPFLDHSPLPPEPEAEVVAAYAVAHTRSGGAPFEVIYESDWEKARKSSAAGSKNVGPWADHREAMIRKTAVRRLAPVLPSSPAFAQAIERDEQPAPEAVELADEGMPL